jgi:hypothetical protein
MIYSYLKVVWRGGGIYEVVGREEEYMRWCGGRRNI